MVPNPLKIIGSSHELKIDENTIQRLKVIERKRQIELAKLDAELPPREEIPLPKYVKSPKPKISWMRKGLGYLEELRP